MKILYVIIPLLVFAEKTFSQEATTKINDMRKLAWLEGSWERTNAKPGRSGFELWTKVNENEWKGKGINLNGSDTTFIEKIKIVVKDGDMFYVADVPENKQPVYFRFTELTDNGFTCENPAHDFPKKIVYAKDGATLKATISADGKSIDYLFRKQ